MRSIFHEFTAHSELLVLFLDSTYYKKHLCQVSFYYSNLKVLAFFCVKGTTMLTLISPGIAISINAQLLSFLFFITISGFLPLIQRDHKIPQNLHFLIFNNTFWSMIIPVFTSFEIVFPTPFPITIHSTLPCLLLYSYCANFSHSLTIWDIVSLFCHTFYKVVDGLFYLSCVSQSLFELPVLAQHTTLLPFQLSSQLFSASIMFLFHLLFPTFLLQTVHTFFCFSIVPSFPSSNSVWEPYSLYPFLLLFLQISHLQLTAQLNSWHTIPSCFLS